MSVPKDLTGRRAGFIRADSRAEGCLENGGALWNCTCTNCGKRIILSARQFERLAKQENASCGCYHPLIGKQFGHLAVLSYEGKNRRNASLYRVRCDACGKETIMTAGNLSRSTTQSCGCLKNKRMADQAEKAGFANIEDGANVMLVNKIAPNANSETGYRWVRHLKKPDWYFYTFVVRGKRYYKGGYTTAESCYKDALNEHDRVLQEENIPSIEDFKRSKLAEGTHNEKEN